MTLKTNDQLDEIFEGDFESLILVKKNTLPKIIILSIVNSTDWHIYLKDIFHEEKGISVRVINTDITHDDLLNIIMFSSFDIKEIYLKSMAGAQVVECLSIEKIDERGQRTTAKIQPTIDLIDDNYTSKIQRNFRVGFGTRIGVEILANTTLIIRIHTA